MERRSELRSLSKAMFFAAGVLVGLVLSVAGILLAAGWFVRAGVTVQADVSSLVGPLRTHMQEEAGRQIPRFLAQAQETMPDKVAREVAGSLGEMKMTFGQITVSMPPEAVSRLEDYLRDLLTAELKESIAGLEWESMVEDWSTSLEGALRSLLLDYEGEFALDLPLPGPWSLPCKVKLTQ